MSRQILRALVDAVESAGVARAAFLRALGCRESDLSTSGRRLALHEIVECCEQAMAATSDPALGLHWAEGLSERAFGPVSHLLSHTGTLREALALLARFEPLFCDQRIYTVVEHAGTVSFRMLPWNFGSVAMERFAAEMVFAGLMKVIQLYATEAKPKAARFRFAAPPHRDEYLRVFGRRGLFEQSVSELVFAGALLDQTSPHGDDDMHEALRSVAEQRLVRLTHSAPHSLRLRQYLNERAPGRVNMTAAARALGLSVRSLRRQLEQEGTSYRDVEYAVLGGAAARLLCEQGMTVQEAAHAMEFSDAATFHRAFKKWTGLTPAELRRRRLAPAGQG